MNDDNTKREAEPSPASAGSQPVAYEIHWKGQDGQYLANPYLVFANEQPSQHWTPAPRCVPLYRSPTLTDEEREAIELAAGDYLYHQDAGGRAQWIRTTLLGLLERLK